MGLASGKMLDATTGSGIPDVEVQFTNAPQKTLSDTRGIWYLEALPGKNTLVLHKDGYEFTPVQVEVLPDRPTLVEEKNLVGNPHVAEGSVRFILLPMKNTSILHKKPRIWPVLTWMWMIQQATAQKP
uniref:Carboxypeptidase regulatory-like domain-containing protein n=1 Tax=Gracilinema caldarium TaxID=215591 RepID=A0A7C3I8U5_9SPIR